MQVMHGSCAIEKGNGSLSLKVSDGAILHWEDFSIGKGEAVHFLQPHSQAWVLNRVLGQEKSVILGMLKSNGQLVLLNPNGILFGKDATVDVGGMIASSLKDVIVEGTLSAHSGAIALMGETVHVSGQILTRVGKHAFVSGEDNPFDVEFKRKNGRVYISSREETIVKPKAHLEGESIYLLSEGSTIFQGSARVGDFEISGCKGFFHSGRTERTGHLILDPDADITISTSLSYNYEGGPIADFCNIQIDTLIDELQKGPVTITTAFEGEGGNRGSIIIKKDVSHTFHSPFPLIFHSEGTGGIVIEGNLINEGTGKIACIAPKTTISGKLISHAIDICGTLDCSGELYSHALRVDGVGKSSVCGKVMVDGGSSVWKGGEALTLSGKWGHLGGGSMVFESLRNLYIEDQGHLFGTNRTTALNIHGVEGIFSIENGRVCAGSAPFSIMGSSISIERGSIESTAPITIDGGRYCHLHSGAIVSQKPIHLNLETDLIMMENSSLQSPLGVRVNAKGDLILLNASHISGRGITLNAGGSLILRDQAAIKGGSGPLYASAGEEVSLAGPKVVVEGGQTTLHAGESISLEQQALVCSTLGNLCVTGGDTIQVDHEACFKAEGGNLDVIVTEGNLHLFGGGSLISSTHGTKIITGKSLIMENYSHIGSIGTEGTTIVVDHLGGSGGIVMCPKTSISTGSSPLRIFTAKRSLNTLDGTLNGYLYSPSLQYLTTKNEKWGTFFPSVFTSSPFTLFHKETGLISIPGAFMTHKDFCRVIIQYIGPTTAEMQRNLHPYNEYTDQSITFTDDKKPYFIRRRSKNEAAVP